MNGTSDRSKAEAQPRAATDLEHGGPRWNRRSLLLSAAGAVLTARSAGAQAAGPVRAPVRVASLSNGLRLLSRTNSSSEMVSVVCLVRAGLPDEVEEQAGLAALTAEALVKGCTRYGDHGFQEAVLQAGGSLRSQPGYDLAEVSVVCNRDQFEKALRLVADVVARPRFSEEDVTAAREVLKRRLLEFEDDFTAASYQALTSQLYPSTPYGRPLNGYVRALDRLTAADVRKFWETHYVQNRMVVSIVGDVDATRAVNIAQKAFEDVPWKPQAAAVRRRQEVLMAPRVDALQRPGPAAQLMAGFLAPGVTRENYPLYAVLDAVVGGGKRGRLFSNIREKHSLGYQMGSFYQPLLLQSHLVGYVITPPFRRNPTTQQSENVIELVKEHLLAQYQNLATTGPTDEELARAKAYVLGRYALKQERTRDQAKWLAWNVAMNLNADFDQYFNTRVPLITREQVQTAAKGCTSQYALVVTLPEQK